MKVVLSAWVLLIGVSVSPVWADMPVEQIEPKHVLVEAQRIQQELILIRNEMGKPIPPLIVIDITDAQPRDVFFQALTLYQKADRMCFDHTRNTGPIPPEFKDGKIVSADVLEVLKKAMVRVNCVNNHWGISESHLDPVINPFASPSDVYMKILEVNRELNFLLDVPYSPSTVYRRVQETIQMVEAILNQNSPEVKFPGLPEFIREKRPIDVYIQNQRCLVILQRISRLTGNKILDFYVEEELFDIAPGDVYDLVSLLFSEIKYIERNYYPKDRRVVTKHIAFSDRKFPSHVFQKSVYLERLLLLWESELSQPLDWEFEVQ